MSAKRLYSVIAVPLSALIFSTLSAAQTPDSATTTPAATAPGVTSLPIMRAANRAQPEFLRMRGQGQASTAGQAAAGPGFKRVGIMPTIGQAASSAPKDNGIQYHGGPIIDDANGVNVYFIWYGNWSNETAAQSIVTDFINHLGGSPYAAINTTYYDMEPGPTGTNVLKDWVTTGIHYMGSTTDNYSSGSTLDDNAVGAVVENALDSGALAFDTNGVYFVLTSADVNETSGFCQSYCAWHGYDISNSGRIAFDAFVGNPEQCPSFCDFHSHFGLPTPNNSVAADGMVNMIAHETEESVSDPFGDAWWFDSNGNENEDQCAWTFGKTYNLPNGSVANMKLGQRQYLIQQNWVNKNGGYCALRWGD
jgi:Phosphate-induced protein 1 conserved region